MLKRKTADLALLRIKQIKFTKQQSSIVNRAAANK